MKPESHFAFLDANPEHHKRYCELVLFYEHDQGYTYTHSKHMAIANMNGYLEAYKEMEKKK